MNKKLIVFVHYLIVLFAVSMPFWLSWKIVALIMLAYHLVFTRGIGYCPLTVWQFGTAKEGFIEKHIVIFFRLFGLSIPKNRKNFKIFIQYGIPLTLVVVAFMREVIGL